MYDIVIGRGASDLEKYGTRGTILLGKHYVQMGQVTSLSNNVLLDVTRSHVVFVCGKRGGGKSFTMGVIAEGVSDLPPEIKGNIAIVILDTMGIYWTMKFPNQKERDLLDKWGIKPKGLDITIFVPKGHFKSFREKGIPADYPFSIRPDELDIEDWCLTLGLDRNTEEGILTERVITDLKESGRTFSIRDIVDIILKDEKSNQRAKDAAVNKLLNADRWGLFDKEGTPLNDLVMGGRVAILDVSIYATMPGGWNIKALVIGLVAKKLFIQRMVSRRDEEFAAVHESVHYFADETEKKMEYPMVWLIIDEAHEFLPVQGETAASAPLITILREGRQPGLSLVLATQQPGKIHTDVMTQSDVIISHMITAKLDTDALGMLMQSYMRKGLDKYLDELPREKGSALILDDNNEHMYQVRIRPRFTWHGGEAPVAIPREKKIFKM
ncbi:MAG: ATP-binding protein [Nanoarchaeota archaeon]|nr:ATP-binding protein [Nanoarchaeota archaeon]